MGRKPDVKIGVVSTGLLKPHPLSERLYGKLEPLSDPFIQLRDSIRQHGILEPLVVTRDNVIISGHSRHQIALVLNLYEVPVVRVKPADELALEEMLIHSNRQREKTAEQKAREVRELKRIESERAKVRQGERTDLKNIVENVPECSKGDARDIAAAAVGWSGRTADKAVAVVDAIDEAEEAGDQERAEELREALNKSVSAGANAARPAKPRKPKPPEPEPQEEEDEAEAIIDTAALAPVQDSIRTWNAGTRRALYEWLTAQL